MLDISLSSIFAGLIFGTMGFVVFRNGKSDGNFWHLILGVLLMGYPYFVSGPFLEWGIGFGLLFIAYKTRDA